MVRLASNVDPAAVLFHDTVANAETQPHALADIFGRKKRIENLVEVIGGDSFAIVADHNQAFPVLVETPYRNGRRPRRIRCALEGVQGVLQQIYKNLRQLMRVGPDRVILRDVLFDSDSIAPLVAHKAQSGVDDGGDGDRSDLSDVWLGEGAQVRDDMGDPIDSILDIVDHFEKLGAILLRHGLRHGAQRIKAGFGEIQRVIDFVDDARAHSAKGGQLLGLGELRFGFLQLFQRRFENLVFARQLALETIAVNEIFQTNAELDGRKRLRHKIIGPRRE